MKKLLLLLLASFCFAYNLQAQCGPGQDTTPPVIDSAGDGTLAHPFRNLLQATVGSVPSGTYYFNFNGSTFQGVLDNDTDGGGWLMILNYVHIAGDNSNLTVRNNDLPLLGSSTLGDNEAGTTNWGHIGNALAAAIDFEEMRLYGVTTGHNRVINFKTSFQGVLNCVKTGTGSFDRINEVSNHTVLSNHSANIPAQAYNEWVDQGDLALTNFPFWTAGNYHWGIRGGGSRWEVDDFANNTQSTIHRVWVRGDLSPVGLTTLTVNLDATGNATVAPGDFGLTAIDNCTTPGLSLSQTDFDCTNVGSNIIQFTATDDQNNNTSIDVTVVIVESAPVITTDNFARVNLDATGNGSITLADLNASATDDCGLQSITLDQTDFDCTNASRTVTVTLTATDVNGNVSTSQVSVAVQDQIDPIVQCVAPITLELDATGSATIRENDLVLSATDNCTVRGISLSKSSFTCADIGDNVVTVRVRDNGGNLVSCSTTVTVTIPSCPSDFTLESDPTACGAVYNYPCASNITSGPASGTLLAIGSTTTFTYDTLDNDGNTVQCSYDVSVVDTRAPLFNTKDTTLALGNFEDTVTVTPQDIIGADPIARDYTVETSGTFDRVDISTSGTEVTLSDDEVSEALPLGFEFGFYGNLYTEFYVSSNGFITFSDEGEDGCCGWDPLPDASTPSNLIAFDMTDLNPLEGGTIRYTTIGTAPNRIVIIDFDAVHYYDTTPDATTTQIKLFEGTNRIEIHATSTFDSDNDKIQGIENIDGTAAVVVPGRNASVWTTNNDYVAFVPTNGAFDNCGIDTMVISPNTFNVRNIGDNIVTLSITDINGNVSEQTATVNITGDCFIDNLTDTNFQIQTSGETCAGKNNGILSIDAIESLNYIATLNGEDYPFNTTLVIPDLVPGTYPLCIAISGITDCEKCYEFVIEEAPVLEGKTTMDEINNKMFVDIQSGTAPYTVIINNKVVGEYNTNSFVVDAKNGGIIEVFSSKAACQGKLSTTIGELVNINAYPNPTRDNVTLSIPNTGSDTVSIEIHNALGITVSSGMYNVTSNKVELSMHSLPAGIYFVSIKGTSKTIRISKQ
ncbi:T9SS type A sorting domain-containing protein [Aquimarina algiphila]|uniref:T9SS type A sorting domain-containing protein n=1 Tax=Aquimarina algiphila TaxID=2047982 RepID=A0A554VP74_9FLAO|nr:T9SS type A sorting domain-containing protein [Aquimarina algiphila]TSE10212.1 T9SS type A sorting domain-containing protein [Aquimarina algiphila]